jgi:hypothetical protein
MQLQFKRHGRPGQQHKTGLRREAWRTDDPVYWCPDPA